MSCSLARCNLPSGNLDHRTKPLKLNGKISELIALKAMQINKKQNKLRSHTGRGEDQ